MDFTLLKKYLQDSVLAPAFLVEGEDDFLRESAVSQIIANTVTEYQELNIDRVNSEIKPNELYSAVSTLPFIASRRAVVVKEYYPKASDITALKKLNFSTVAESCVIIINNKKTGAVSDKVLPNLIVIDCNKKEVATVSSWIKALLKSAGKDISQDTAQKFAEYCGRDMTRIKTEINKLKNYCDNTVTDTDIENIVSKDTEYEIYMFSNFVIKGNAQAAYQMAEDFSLKGSSGQVTVFISMLYKQFRRMLYSKDLKLSEQAVGKILGIKPYAIKMLRKDCANFSIDSIIKCLNYIADTEYKIKSGLVDAETGLKTLLAILLKRGNI